VHVHLGTTVVLARCALLERTRIEPGEVGWAQLRLEAPLLARAGDRVILRSYSPVATIGGAEVAEPFPPKRRGLDAAVRARLESVLDGPDHAALGSVLELAGWAGLDVQELPIRSGRPPQIVEAACASEHGEVVASAGGTAFSPGVLDEAAERIRGALEAELARDPLRAAVPLDILRAVLPAWAHPAIAQLALRRLAEHGALELVAGGAAPPGHRPALTSDQATACEGLASVFRAAGLAPPQVEELPAELAGRSDLWSLLKHLETGGRLRLVTDGLYVDAAALEQAVGAVSARLRGRTGLTPADFRDVLPVTRKHLIPLLNYLDGLGVTVRREEGRDVPDPG
jgi:selenocysteine-specific elongation factor